MPITAEKYEELKKVLSPKLSPEVYRQVNDAIREYELAFQNKLYEPERQQFVAEQEKANAPAELSLSARPKLEEPEQPMLTLNPSFSLLPQALAVQPATTHPGGDQAAAAEWRVDPQGASKGKVFVYDVPLSVAKKDLLEHPEKIRALYPETFGEWTPDRIAAMDSSAELYKDYNNFTWRDTAAAAASAGKTAIRHSKAPWLQDGNGGSVLSQLALKLEGAAQPAVETGTAFIMGVDDIAGFGAGRAVTEASGVSMTTPDQGGPPSVEVTAPSWLGPAPGDEQEAPREVSRVGGVTASDPREHFAQLEEEHPWAYAGGQALAALRGWGPAGMLFGQILRGGRAAAEGLGGSLGARIGAGTVAGAVGAGAQQAGIDAVDAASAAARGEDSGATLGALPERAAHAAAVGLPFAAGGALVGEFAGSAAGGPRGDREAGTGGVRWGNRYGGAVGNLEADLGEEFGVSMLRGPYSKPIEKLKVEARKADVPPGDMLARDIAKPLAGVLDQDTRAALQQVSQRRDAFLASEEGKKLIPVRNFLDQTVKELRADMQAAGDQGIPKPVGRAGSSKELVDFFNQQVDTVSLAPREGAIALSPEEAQAFLGRAHQKTLLKEKPVKAPGGGPQQPFERARDAGAPIEAHRTVDVRGEPSPPPLVEQPAIPGAGRFRAPEGVLGEPLPERPPSPGPAPPPMIEPPVPARPSTAINASEPRQTPEAPAARPAPEAALSAGKPPADSPAAQKARREAQPRGKGLADTLRKRGVEKVYVMPRAYDAEHTEALLDKINAVRQESKRDLTKLDQAARLDRDARTLDGEAGGWSRLQNAHSELIEKSKLAEELGAPGGNAFKVITGYGKPKSGEAPRVDVLRAAADKAGVREQLNRVRSLERYDDLRRQTTLERANPGTPERGMLTRGADLLSIRMLPFWDMLSGMGGGLGRAANLGRDEDEKERRKKELEASK